MSPTDPRLLRALGIQRSFTDHTGARSSAPAATLRAITSALTKHLDPADPLRDLAAKQLRAGVSPCTVAWSDRPATATLILTALPTTTISIHASLPNGGFRGWAFDPQDLDSSPTTLVDGAPALALHLPIPDDIPLGATPLAITLGKRTLNTTLLSAPRANQPTQWIHRERSIGIFTPTYSLRSTEDRIGIGNLSDLADLGAWAASQGCGYLGTLQIGRAHV